MKWLRDRYHRALAYLADLLYRNPSRGLVVVGVTGTKGKSTVVELLAAVFGAAGEKTASISSVRTAIGDSVGTNRTGNSMPGRGKLQRFLAHAAKAGCRYAFIEVTSQGITQHRHRFIEWDAALFTNLAPEHIEAHGSFEAYREAKLSFFQALARSPKPDRIAVVNVDDPSSHLFIEAVHGSGVRIMETHAKERGEELQLSGTWIMAPVNRENAALVAAYAETRGIPRHVIRRALDEFPGVPGRLEYIQETPFAVVVDYAHTPDSLERAYEFLRSKHGGRLICVLGAAGGGRDKWKRPEMGKVASQLCDEVVLTNEDPYDEDPAAILAEVASEMPSGKVPVTIPDRREALMRAIGMARPGDVVVATGKGSESSIHFARGTTIPWSERGEIEKILHK